MPCVLAPTLIWCRSYQTLPEECYLCRPSQLAIAIVLAAGRAVVRREVAEPRATSPAQAHRAKGSRTIAARSSRPTVSRLHTSRPWSPSLRGMTRKPSCLISCSHSAPVGGCGALVGRQAE
jgi:hypothetical protein